jgi:hypothetical protein
MEQLTTLKTQRETLQTELAMLSATGSIVSVLEQVSDIERTKADPIQAGADNA